MNEILKSIIWLIITVIIAIAFGNMLAEFVQDKKWTKTGILAIASIVLLSWKVLLIEVVAGVLFYLHDQKKIKKDKETFHSGPGANQQNYEQWKTEKLKNQDKEP